MGKPRADGLPSPYSTEAEYLAAILGELREVSVKLDLALSLPAVEDHPVEEKPANEIELVEAPKKTVVGDKGKEDIVLLPRSPLPTPDPAIDGDTVAAAEKAASEAGKIRERQAKKPATRKPRAKRQTKPKQTRKAK